jgi:hypothetical protein
MQRVAAGDGHGDAPARPEIDPQMRKEVIAAFVRGRKIEDYKAVLEHWGFAFVPREKLPPWTTGTRRTEGEWRSVRLRMAFTDTDVLAGWPSPADFDAWIRKYIQRKQAARAGIVLP